MMDLAIMVLFWFGVFFVHALIRTIVPPKEKEDLYVFWPFITIAIIAICIIPLIVYACKGGFSGMKTVGDAIYHIVDMVFSGNAGMASNLIKGLCGFGFVIVFIHTFEYIGNNQKL